MGAVIQQVAYMWYDCNSTAGGMWHECSSTAGGIPYECSDVVQ